MFPVLFGKTKRRFRGLLDLIPDAYGLAAWDVSRRLGGRYDVPPFRAFGDDGVEQDFYATGGFIDTAALLAFRDAHGTKVWCAKAYDQTGNNRDAVQATHANQPELVVVNGRVEMVFSSAVLDFYSPSFSSAWNPAEIAFITREKVASSGTWTDGTSRRIARIAVDTTYDLKNQRQGNNIVAVRYSSSNAILITGLSTTNFLVSGLSASKLSDTMIAYLDGVQFDSPVSSLVTWTGSLSSSGCVIGANDTTKSSPWVGSISTVIPILRAISASEHQQAANWLNS